MALDFNNLASDLTSRIVNGDAVKSATGDEGSFTFESTLEQANALKVLQDIEIRERRRKGPVKPGFFGLQPFNSAAIDRFHPVQGRLGFGDLDQCRREALLQGAVLQPS